MQIEHHSSSASASSADANIKIWVCTGDKQETAINIGYSCKLLVPGMTLLIANCESLQQTQEWVTSMLQQVCEEGDDASRDIVCAHFLVSSTQYEHLCLSLDESARPQLAMIIDGATLEFALLELVRNDWLRLGKLCKAVIACRVSPLQKADIVR